MLFVPFWCSAHSHRTTDFLADLNLLNFVFVFLMSGWTTTNHRVASAAIARSPFSECLKSQSAERSSIWDCISSKHGYEGNAAFQIGKDGETEERHERRFRFLNVVVGYYAGFSVYKREADGPMGMH